MTKNNLYQLVISFLFLILVYSCTSKNQEIIKDENGNIFLKCELKNGVRHGKCYEYYPNGAIKYISNWVAGVCDGESIEYYENEGVYATAIWKNGRQNGKRVEYFENGKIKDTSIWKDDKANGECVEYFENGSIKIKSYFVNDQSIEDEFYDEDGRVQKEYHYMMDILPLLGQKVKRQKHLTLYYDNKKEVRSRF